MPKAEAHDLHPPPWSSAAGGLYIRDSASHLPHRSGLTAVYVVCPLGCHSFTGVGLQPGQKDPLIGVVYMT
eukprot:2734584-Karenia_brevis.AAC.1